jgi:hypothetical protein
VGEAAGVETAGCADPCGLLAKVVTRYATLLFKNIMYELVSYVADFSIRLVRYASGNK